MLGIDGARQAQHVRVQGPLRFVEARSAGQHEVRDLQQRGLALAHLARRIRERRQLVHAVVDDRARAELAQHRQRHRRVEPDDAVIEAPRAEVGSEQRLERRQLIVVEAARIDRRVRAQHLHTRRRPAALQPGGAVGTDRFLDEGDRVMAREARQQVLGTLEDE
ncbi:MAG TPA: hypothetical protein VNO30_01790, partial [Kofleriaceae bacterium]|nr:hypothetical protein [Kofleriaceae bacterium]